jgi:hypothetical protein
MPSARRETTDRRGSIQRKTDMRSDRKTAMVLKNFTWVGIIVKRTANRIEKRIQNPGLIAIWTSLKGGRK